MATELINDPDLAAFISDRAKGRHLDPFLGVESTVADAAAELGITAQRMHYWVRQMEEMGLLVRQGQELRGRARSVIFSSSADSYSLPLELLPTSDLETLELHFQPVWRAFLRSVVAAGRRYADGWVVSYRRTGGLPAFHIEPTSAPPHDAPLANAWARLDLTPAKAKLLKAELEELLDKYLGQPEDTNSKAFIAHIGLVEASE